MKRIAFFIALFCVFTSHSQTDYSNRWEDFFSYNNVQDFVKVKETIYALADNAVFIYNTQTKQIDKISSVHGLSGETATAIHYNITNNRLVIGYENGSLEIVDKDGRITTSPEIANFNRAGEKRINDIYEYNNRLYLATSFAIVVYDINKLEFGDTYFIATNSLDENVRRIMVLNDTIYATSPNGIYTANINSSSLIDFNNWKIKFSGNFTEIENFNNSVYTSQGNSLYKITGDTVSEVHNLGQKIVGLKASSSNLSVSTSTKMTIFDNNLSEIVQVTPTEDFTFTLNNAFEENSTIYLATKEYGILQTKIGNTQNFEEVHPEGPLSNDVFSIDVHNNNLWVVYGGYTNIFAPSGVGVGYSHFNGKKWLNTRRHPKKFPMRDFVDVSIDKKAENRVSISSMGSTTDINSVQTGGVFLFENDEKPIFYNQNNSDLQNIEGAVGYVSVRISTVKFDAQQNLWVANVGAKNRIKKLSTSGKWSSFNISKIQGAAWGMKEIAFDQSNSLWIGTRQNGIYIFNENGNRQLNFNTEVNKGNLPSSTVSSIAVDSNNRVWIGTITGLVVYNNASGVFDSESLNAEPIVILEEGKARRLLGDQKVNTIFIDGANNKWFGTDTGGAIFTNPNGQNTLATFNTDNSPLPSNKINKIKVDEITGKVYFATSKGLMVYNSKVSPFGDKLGEVYAYPNPVLKNHNIVTIDGRKGTHLPKGTNIKILDVAGNLVYETNVVEGQQLQGGKAVWNKRNLAGNKVASGIYIVLLSNEDGTESSTTKIAIVN